MLYNSLTGEAEQELEHVSIEDLYTDSGVDTILKYSQHVESPLEQKMIYQKRKFLQEFENMRRYAGENMRAFINRFRRSQRNLKPVGIDISGTYDTESLGARLLDRSGLTAEQQRMILVGTQQSLRFEAVSEAMVLQFPDFRGAPPIAGQGNGKEGNPREHPRVLTSQVHPQHLQLPVLHLVRVMQHLAKPGLLRQLMHRHRTMKSRSLKRLRRKQMSPMTNKSTAMTPTMMMMIRPTAWQILRKFSLSPRKSSAV